MSVGFVLIRFFCVFNSLREAAVSGLELRLDRPLGLTLLGFPDQTIYDGEHAYRFSSSSGFRHGDPLSPLLFSLSIQQTLKDLQRTLKGYSDFLILSYLDDIAILSNDPTPSALSRTSSPSPLLPFASTPPVHHHLL
jgi:hypothetical protein